MELVKKFSKIKGGEESTVQISFVMKLCGSSDWASSLLIFRNFNAPVKFEYFSTAFEYDSTILYKTFNARLKFVKFTAYINNIYIH